MGLIKNLAKYTASLPKPSDEVPLWEHQRQAIVKARGKDYFGLFMEIGCLAAHTKIKVNRNGLSRTYTIEQLYRKFNNTEIATDDTKWKTKANTYIRSWNGKYIGLNKVLRVVRSGEKRVYELKTYQAGYLVRATADHEILTNRGFVQLKDIIPGQDMVAVDDLKRHQKKEEQFKTRHKKQRYKITRVGKFHKYARKSTNHGRRVYVIETHRLLYEAKLNGITFENMVTRTHKPNLLRFVNPKKFHIHHKNRDTLDNRINNLQLLTAKAHLKEHGNYRHFGHGSLTYRLVREIIPMGVEMTYDISCRAPHHNFVANNIVVHNCGKSATIINILEDKFEPEGKVLKTLFFAPPVVLENLKREFKKFGRLSKDKVIVLTGSMEARLKKFQQSNTTGYIFITNYEALYNKPLFTAFKAWHPDIFVADESQLLKDYSSKRSRAARDLADTCKYRYIMSGTPVLNSQMDLFSQIRILDRGVTFGKNDVLFRSTYFYNANESIRGTHGYFPNWLPKPGINKVLQDRIADFTITAKKSEVLDLPPYIQKDQYCEMGAKQAKAYKEMEEDFITYINSQACVAELAITKSLRLSQILSGFISFEDGREEMFDYVPRTEALSSIIQHTFPHKVIVWCVFKKNFETIEKICQELNEPVCKLIGETKDKQEQIDLFQGDRGPRIMIAHPAAGGVGVNLTAASYTVYYSKSCNLGHDLQSEGRNYRGGSEIHEKITRIDLVTPGTIDDVINKALKRKKEIGDEILGNKKIFEMMRSAYGTR